MKKERGRGGGPERLPLRARAFKPREAFTPQELKNRLRVFNRLSCPHLFTVRRSASRRRSRAIAPALSPTPPCASRRRSRARRPLHTAIAPRTTIVHRHGGRGPAGPIPRTKHAGVGRRALVIVPDTRPIVHRSQLSKRVVVGAARARAGAGHGALVIVPAARFPLRTQAPAPPRLPPTSVIIFSLSISLSLSRLPPTILSASPRHLPRSAPPPFPRTAAS